MQWQFSCQTCHKLSCCILKRQWKIKRKRKKHIYINIPGIWTVGHEAKLSGHLWNFEFWVFFLSGKMDPWIWSMRSAPYFTWYVDIAQVLRLARYLYYYYHFVGHCCTFNGLKWRNKQKKSDNEVLVPFKQYSIKIRKIF